MAVGSVLYVGAEYSDTKALFQARARQRDSFTRWSYWWTGCKLVVFAALNLAWLCSILWLVLVTRLLPLAGYVEVR